MKNNSLAMPTARAGHEPVSAVRATIPVALADYLGRLLADLDEQWMTDTQRAVAIVEAWEAVRP